MKTINCTDPFVSLLQLKPHHKIYLFLSIFLFVTACASSGTGDATAPTDTGTESAAQDTQAAPAAGETATATNNDSATAAPASSEVAFVPPDAANSQNLPEITKAPQIVEECKKEPYAEQEVKARASIAKGKQATEEGKYGVGFRNADEFTKWSNMHNHVYTEVSQACADLSNCAKQYKTEKEKSDNCAAQARLYNDWKRVAAEFAHKVKSVESTQPPLLCSTPPAADDLPRCYEQLADEIDKACKTEACAEASACWRSVSFLDIALNQAESACKFSHIKLEECRGYSEASGRRKAKFSQCGELQTTSGVKVVPVL